VLAALLCLLPAGAPEGAAPDPVVTIRGLVAGDVACYVTVSDAAGRSREEMASFDLCERERELVGRRVRLRHERAKVLAESCQGNPDCTETRTVQLVVEARPVSEAPRRSR